MTRTEDVAHMTNSYFCSLGTKLVIKVDPSSNPLLSGNHHVNDKFTICYARPVNVQDIKAALADAKTSKSFGNDNISYFFLKRAPPFIESSLAILFKKSIATAVLLLKILRRGQR